jgi:hypothetical protein
LTWPPSTSSTAPPSAHVYWQVNGASGWNSEVIAGPGTTFSGPSVAQDGTATVISAEGAANSLDFYWAVNGNSTWNPEVVAGAGTTESAPAMVAQGGGVDIAAAGPGVIDFYWALNGTPTWHPSYAALAAGGVGVAMTAYGGGVHLAYLLGTPPLSQIIDSSNANGNPAWTGAQLTFEQTDASAPAVTMNNGSLNMADVQSNGNLNFYWRPVPASSSPK